MGGLIDARRQFVPLSSGTAAAARAVKVATQQYKRGVAIPPDRDARHGGTRHDPLPGTRLGWDSREGRDLETREQMYERTNWGLIDRDRISPTESVATQDP